MRCFLFSPHDGSFKFKVQGLAPGGSTTVTLFLLPGVPVTAYYKYGPTPNNSVNHWYNFSFDGMTGMNPGMSPNEIELHFVDGIRGDDDLTANGEIVEPGAPALEAAIENKLDIKRARVKLKRRANKDRFDLRARLIPSADSDGSDGYDVLTENVTFTAVNAFDEVFYSETIPAGSFVPRGKKSKRFSYRGSPGAITRMVFRDNRVTIVARKLDLSDSSVFPGLWKFLIQIGDDVFSDKAFLDNKGRFRPSGGNDDDHDKDDHDKDD